jgi:TonB family protein
MKFLKFMTLLVAPSCCCTVNAAVRHDDALPRFVTLTWKLSLDPSGDIAHLELPDDEVGSALYAKMEPVVRGWHFTPGKLDGQPAPTNTLLTVVVTFEADGSDGYRVRVVSAKTGGSAKHLVPPKYPGDSIRMGHGGLVLVKMEHDADGRVVSATSVKPKKGGVNDWRLVDASLAAARQWTFDPETIGGHGVPGSDVMPFCFFLRPSEYTAKAPAYSIPATDRSPSRRPDRSRRLPSSRSTPDHRSRTRRDCGRWHQLLRIVHEDFECCLRTTPDFLRRPRDNFPFPRRVSTFPSSISMREC